MSSLYLSELRAGRPSAVSALRRLLREHGGNVRAVAGALGLAESSLRRAIARSAEASACFAKHAMGRSGAAKVALESREVTNKRQRSSEKA